jgi:hypothetical protein
MLYATCASSTLIWRFCSSRPSSAISAALFHGLIYRDGVFTSG